jgi:hypothetical protein
MAVLLEIAEISIGAPHFFNYCLLLEKL